MHRTGSLMASVVVIALSKATHLCGAFSDERSVMTAAGVVSEPVPTVVLIAMCGGFSSFSEALTPWNSFMFRPSDRKSTRLNSSHANISYAVFCLKKKKIHLRQ